MLGMVFGTALVMHIAGGTIALLAGPVAMRARKGGTLHRMAGRSYAAAMACTTGSALYLALVTRNRLLLVIAVFSFFLAYTGWRALWQKHLHEGRGARWFDWLVAAGTLLFSAGLLAAGLVTGREATDLFFGSLGVALAIRHMRELTGRVRPGGWVVRHMIGMSAAYIATVSAFAVVSLRFLPAPVTFIVPTLIGTPLIVWTARRLEASQQRRRVDGSAPATA